MISGSEYPTSNNYLPVIWRVKKVLDERASDGDVFVQRMVSEMKEKYDKYWKECNLLMAIASVLDPRYKMFSIDFVFNKIYAKEDAEAQAKKVQMTLIELFNEYKEMIEMSYNHISGRGSHGSTSSCSNDLLHGSSSTSEFQQFLRQVENVQPDKSELEIYLEERLFRMQDVEDSNKFDVLGWWKCYESKYKILSRMARDILAIPVSTVVSESTFSAGSRVIDPYRASLATETVQALICGGDWVRRLHGIRKGVKVDEKALEIPLAHP